MTQRLPVLLGILLLFPSIALAQFSRPPTGFEPGQAFPDLILPTLEDGQSASLAQFQGKKVILHIFASW